MSCHTMNSIARDTNPQAHSWEFLRPLHWVFSWRA